MDSETLFDWLALIDFLDYYQLFQVQRGASYDEILYETVLGLSADGSPVAPYLTEPSVFRGATQAMVVAPDSTLPLLLITPDQWLYMLGSNGNWPRTDSKVAAPAVRRGSGG